MARAHQLGALDVRRMACICAGQPADHAEDVLVVEDTDFDIEKTIFRTVDIPEVKAIMRKDMAKKVYWHDAAIARVVEAYSRVPPSIPQDSSLLDFIHDECEFKVEHADGSFLDHLKFCYDYSAIHYRRRSPKPLFLHSILGTGTNFFPMAAEKIPKLAAMLTPEEMAQVESFPSILRLVNSFTLMDALSSRAQDLDTLKGISFYRVIDNKPLYLSTEQLWDQLNYQLIHSLDFLPLANWAQTASKSNFQVAASLYSLMQNTRKLEAEVNLDVSCRGKDGKQISLGQAMDACGAEVLIKERQGIAWFNKYFSDKMGHNLDFELHFSPRSAL
eukprot:gb/GFBE01001512.1/.p1 GENE.gb/GFBE01001512.1/~~gb/GFBE01001512.1/.p1  ORF type:complete len:331 (+),score=71.45 gb/GFBE01001512.1/:1-993(+)